MKNLTMQLRLETNWGKTACALLFVFVATAIALPAQTFTALANFPENNSANPRLMSLVQGADGNFYGTTCDVGCVGEGGVNGFGTVFKVTPTGTLTTLYDFCPQKTSCPDGAFPIGGLVLGTDGNFYGTTAYGGANDDGTVFKITSGGTLTTLHTFDSTDGAYPYTALVQATNGNFYGTTSYGGANAHGTVFEITSGGTLTTLHSFDFTDGAYPEAALVQATNGNFYGTTFEGGAIGDGTVFSITSGGTLTTLHSFDGADGYLPLGALVQATNGNLYGTTLEGGANGYGTVFEITSGGTLTTLHSFDSTDGALPEAGLVQATNGIFYGTTLWGGASDVCAVGCGTVFSITSGGTLTTLHSFDSTDGDDPYGGLVQATNGTFYGTTYSGGASNDGTIFSLAVGLGPFVKTLPISGRVGAAVTILATNLTGATSVTFNGTAATFTVVSSSEITTTVPAGATTGKLKVVTPGATLSSYVSFRVTPVISSFSPTSGPVGTNVVITGNSLTGATSVTFGGVKATSFTVNSYTQITATAPTGAKTGKIAVTTPGGTVSSTGTFTVN
jgi:uncharacterized repeat protein (TIGR03803 family)